MKELQGGVLKIRLCLSASHRRTYCLHLLEIGSKSLRILSFCTELDGVFLKDILCFLEAPMASSSENQNDHVSEDSLR